ncbi:endonuclease/exonuclease/phosphatase family protein [Aeromicrobium sp. A1-2]|uniref:endonuclease/exonuclease/phosphatase family protein n=1 Tax=Aeromicrobium sp. A1-2 TaxID=2107713 RepID=UPI0013C3734B|nr:endonuclease/exonuclease/phosphatase family protein [Aeromicrobium sp. A1-2]
MRARLGAVVATATLTLGGLVATTSPAQAISAPGDLHAVHVATKGVGLSWDRAGEDAYRVRFATNSAMTKGKDTWDVLGNYFEWTHTDANPSRSYPRLTPGKTYYFQVKAITKEDSFRDRSNLSSYSKAIAVKLPTRGYPEIEPVDLKATAGGAEAMYVSWRSRGPGLSYVLRYTTDPSLTVLKWKSVKFDTHGGVVTGLDPSRTYYFRSRAIDSRGKAQSPYSARPGLSAKTSSSAASPRISAISYNIRKASGSPSWSSRRTAVAANITASQPDVLALQEATPLRNGTANNTKQYDDIINLIGNQKYSLVTRRGSSGTKLAYNTERLSVLDTGVEMLYEYGSAERYAVWAIFKDRSSGKTFFAVNTHLEPGSQTDSTNNDVRIRQANEVLDVIEANAGGRPAIILGDMNSSRAAKPTNGQYYAFTGGEFVAPLDNASSNWAAGSEATAEHVLDGAYNSSNGFDRKAHLTAYPLGTNIDYIYTSPGIRVGAWRTRVNLDTSGDFIGTIPSDHNLVQMWLHLP